MVSRGIIITGGLGGIGMAAARAFAAEGASILLVDCREDKDDAAAKQLCAAGASEAISFHGDITQEEEVARAIDMAVQSFGQLDVLVNVAGAMIYKPIVELTGADWQRLLSENLIGAAMFIGHAFRHMPPGGAIVNIASVHARRTAPLVAPYAAAKAGLVSLTRSAAIEGREFGIRVNAILPGAIDTQMLRDSPNIRSGAEVLDPSDVGLPDDIGALTAFLASEAARFITGEDVVADGGRMGRL